MKTLSFTKKGLLSITNEGERKDYRDPQTPGLFLRVSSTGKKVFCLYQRVKGKENPTRITLGTFPTMSIPEARVKATELKALIAAGTDPADVTRKLKSEPTLQEGFDEFLANKRTKRGAYLGEKTKKEYKKSFAKHLAKFAAKKVSIITAVQVKILHKTIGNTAPTAANRVLALLSSLFNHLIGEGVLTVNLAAGIRKFPENQRERVLGADELPRFFNALAEEPSADIRDYILLSLLTGARKSNVLAMKWSQINLDRGEWRIPVTKSGKPATVTLSPECVAILEERRKGQNQSPYVFPSHGRSGHLVEPKKGWSRILERAGIEQKPAEGYEGLRLHDLRRSLGSWMAGSGASLVIIGKALSHQSLASTQVYARLALDPVREQVNKAGAAILRAGKR